MAGTKVSDLPSLPTALAAGDYLYVVRLATSYKLDANGLVTSINTALADAAAAQAAATSAQTDAAAAQAAATSAQTDASNALSLAALAQTDATSALSKIRNPAILKITADLALDPDTHRTILGDASGGAINVDLPEITADLHGVTFIVKKIDSSTNAVTLRAFNAGDGTDVIDGAATQPITGQYDSLTIQAYYDAGGDSFWSIE